MLEQCWLIAKEYHFICTEPKSSPEKADGTSLPTYAKALEALFEAILDFEVEVICFLFKSGFKKYLREVTKWNDWKGMLDTIQERLDMVRDFDDLSQRYIQRRDFKQAQSQHNDIKDQLSQIQIQLSEQKLTTSEESRRREFFTQLSSLDCQDDYSRLRDSHQKSTNDWLLEEGFFKTWEETPHSLLWIHGESNVAPSWTNNLDAKDLLTLCTSWHGKISVKVLIRPFLLAFRTTTVMG